MLDAERLGHAPFGAEHVDGQGKAGAFDIFEQQRRAAGFAGAVGDLADFENGIDFGLDAEEIAFGFQLFQERCERFIRHKNSPRRAQRNAERGSNSKNRKKFYWILVSFPVWLSPRSSAYSAVSRLC